jgi:type II secretory pathway component PulC
MFLSNVFFRYTAVALCSMFLVTTTVVADGTGEAVVVEQTVTPEKNRETEVQLSNDRIEQQELRKLMNLTLVGTVLSDSGKPVAIIEDKGTNSQRFYRLDEWIKGGRITKILRDRIVLVKNGIEIEMKLNSGTRRSSVSPAIANRDTDTENIVSIRPSPAETTNVSNNVTGFDKIEKKDLKALSKLKKFDVPVALLRDGRMQIGVIEPEGTLSKIGLRHGDIIISINAQIPGNDISFPEAVNLALAEDGNTLRIELERNEKFEVVYLDIDDSSK